MNKYGFFGGSFNPPTKAHIYLAEKVVTDINLDKLFFVPVGNYYSKPGLIDEKYRYEMLKLACKNNSKLGVLDIELNTDKELRAIDAFKMIRKLYPNDELYYIMGADNLSKITKWKNSEELIKNFKFIILDRGNYIIDDIMEKNSMLVKYKYNFTVIENHKHAKTCSTDVRNKMKNVSLNNDISDEIWKYIKEKNLYLKEDNC